MLQSIKDATLIKCSKAKVNNLQSNYATEMSTSNIPENTIARVHGWFRLLTEAVGRRKHFAASPIVPSSPQDANDLSKGADSLDGAPVTATPAAARSPRRHNQVTGFSEANGEEGWSSSSSLAGPLIPPCGGQTPYTISVNFSRGNRGFGFSVTWTRPPRVERVETGLPAAQAGLLPGDYIIFVGTQNIVRMQEKDVMNVIRECGDNLSLEVYRKGVTTTPAPLPSSSRRSLLQSYQQQPQQQQQQQQQPNGQPNNHLTSHPSNQLTVHQLPQFQSKPPLTNILNTIQSRPQNTYSHHSVFSHHYQKVQKHYPLILSSPSRINSDHNQVSRPYLSAVVQV